MPLKTDKYYTMQVHLHRHYDGQKLTGIPIEFKDLTFEQVQETRKVVWQRGIFVETSAIAFEAIDPLHIKHVFFLEQPQKFGI